jgi:hypothetical protein
MNLNPSSAPLESDPSLPPPAAPEGFRHGRNQFYTIAALSVINSLLAQFGAGLHFVVGLGFTELSDAILLQGFKEAGAIAHAAALFFTLFIAGLVCLFAWLTGRGNRVIFIIGIVLYCIDALIYLYFQQWLSVGFHVWILIKLFSSWGMTRR